MTAALESSGDLLHVAFSKTKQGWVRGKDGGGLLLEFREDPALEPEPVRVDVLSVFVYTCQRLIDLSL